MSVISAPLAKDSIGDLAGQPEGDVIVRGARAPLSLLSRLLEEVAMARIVVVGGGVVGCSIAWHLAERNLGELTLIERDRIGSGTTWHSAGNLTWRPGARYDDAVVYAFETIRRLTEETGQETGWLKTGRLFLAHGQAAT